MDLPDLDEPVCPTCDSTFESFHAYSAHHAGVHDGPPALIAIVGAERLVNLYRTMSEGKVADVLGVSQVTVHNALQELDVDTSNPRHSELPNFITSQGYERITHRDSQILHHRLLAVAYFGFESLPGNIVHHKNNIPWNNREENLELMTQNEHASTHFSKT